MRSTRYVWGGFWAEIGGIAALSLPVWLLGNALAAMTFFALSVLALFAYHIRNLHRLVVWSRTPIGSPVPRAFGVWDYVFSDINQRARSNLDQRNRLTQALSRFREATTAMPDGVVLLSADNFIEWINPAGACHFDIDATRDLGQPITNLVRQPDFVAYMKGPENAEPVICRLSRHAGTVLSILSVPFGEEQRMVLSRDITQFERIDTMRRDFVANVSHELKTPLTVVGGFIETLDDMFEDLSAEEARSYLKMASDQAERMKRLVEDLLELASLESRALASHEEKVEIAPLLEMIQGEAQAFSVGRHAIRFESDGPVALLGSRKELHSAFLNLVTNAVRYTPEGGRITVRWGVAAGGGARFSVEDSGIGIALEHIPRLTERFYRVDRGRSRESGGTGLGLAIVKHALSRHQASLQIESKPGKGSTFAAVFPVDRVWRPVALR